MLSGIELSERVRTLPFSQRLRYRVLLALAITLLFLVTAGLAAGLAILYTWLVVGRALTVEDALVMGTPALFAFLMAMGFTGGPGSEGVISGQKLTDLARKAARRGFINGLIIGAVFGMLWAAAFGMGLVYVEGWDDMVKRNMLTAAVLLALAVAPGFALFRGIGSIINDVVLRLVVKPQV
jgi:hypothetical protein